MTQVLRSPFPLTLLPPETRSACYPPPPSGTVLMPLIIDDAFYDDPDVCGLPACSVAFVTLAGAWSARNSQSGFVPAALLARFTDDPDQAVRPLISAGIAERAKGGGVRILSGHGITIVNAADVEEKAQQVREAARERQRKSRARRKELNAGANDVTCDIPAPSHVTAPVDRSDLDLSPSRPKSRSRSKSARTRGPAPGTPKFRDQVAAKFAEAAGVAIGPDRADAIAADVLGAREGVDNPLLYVLRAIENESGPAARWLPELPPVPPAARQAPGRRPHCGDPCCNPRTRRRETPDTGADDGPCPKCSGTDPAWVEASA